MTVTIALIAFAAGFLIGLAYAYYAITQAMKPQEDYPRWNKHFARKQGEL
jgi:hypothetical protein